MKKILIGILFASALAASLPVPDYFSADFTQVVRNKETDKQLYYSGKMWMKMPDEAKWEYYIPLKKTLCLSGSRAWVIEPELEQATLFRLKKSIPLFAILEHAEKIGKNLYKAEFEGVEYRLKLDTDGKISTISYLDEMGNRVTLRFQNVATEPFDSSRLTCEVPDDFDIIDGRY
ncbi:LolA-like outer membrane lipoprotein chaperone [Hydrogenimonas sp.]